MQVNKDDTLMGKVIGAGKVSSATQWAEEMDFGMKEWITFRVLTLFQQNSANLNFMQL